MASLTAWVLRRRRLVVAMWAIVTLTGAATVGNASGDTPLILHL
jgi:hypothetical protein